MYRFLPFSVVLLSMVFTHLPAGAESPPCGDVNGDLELNVLDIVASVGVILGTSEASTLLCSGDEAGGDEIAQQDSTVVCVDNDGDGHDDASYGAGQADVTALVDSDGDGFDDASFAAGLAAAAAQQSTGEGTPDPPDGSSDDTCEFDEDCGGEMVCVAAACVTSDVVYTDGDDACLGALLCYEFFSALDLNADGVVDADEVTETGGTETVVASIDANGDGLIASAELAEALSPDDPSAAFDPNATAGAPVPGSAPFQYEEGCQSCAVEFGYWTCVAAGASCNGGVAAALAVLAAAATGAPGAFLALLGQGGWIAVTALTLAELAAVLTVSVGLLQGVFFDWWKQCKIFYCGIDEDAVNEGDAEFPIVGAECQDSFDCFDELVCLAGACAYDPDGTKYTEGGVACDEAGSCAPGYVCYDQMCVSEMPDGEDPWEGGGWGDGGDDGTAGMSCAMAGDCPPGTVCMNSTCQPATGDGGGETTGMSCATAGDCPPGTVCTNSMCQPDMGGGVPDPNGFFCAVDWDCPSGYTCLDAACVM